MSDIINSIAHSYDGEEVLGAIGDYENMSIPDKSVLLEDYLVGICNSLAEVERLTGNRKIDSSYLLTIVGSYLIGLQTKELDEGTTPPSKLFEDSLYPTLANQDTLTVEAIEEDDDDITDSTTDIEGDVAEDTPDIRA